MWVIWLLVIVFGLLQATVLPLDVVTWLALWVLLTIQAPRSFVMIFLLGVVVDLLRGTGSVGWHSFIYLVAGIVLWFYRRLYNPYYFIFLFLFIFFTVLSAGWLQSGEWHWIEAGVAGTLGIVFRGRMADVQKSEGKLRV